MTNEHRWRAVAEQIRAVSGYLRDPCVRQVLEDLAESYDAMAEQAAKHAPIVWRIELI